jgi:uncharacterized protein YjbJ (UPF0337 family)
MNDRDKRTDAEEAAANQTKGKLNQVKGNVKEAWGEVTGDKSTEWSGRKDQVKGKLQEGYGDLKEKESRIKNDLDDVDPNKRF